MRGWLFEDALDTDELYEINKNIKILLTAGDDPMNRDLVRMGCTADDSDRSPDNPYLSDWLPPGAESEAVFTFYSPGKKQVYCTSYSRVGVTSPSVSKELDVK
ncbi:MAG: hypothetical protein Q3M24_13550 [Candidatus Electrothrix aestuarii]|uniref:Uncharacterized protein n=1 Tax=Candidatus Electrothrix aestuarii TaxID=3062594 RepID=A0AAU8LR77_9BACT